MTAFGQTSINYVKMIDTEETENCFSRTNFESVLKYIADQIKKNNTVFYRYDDYELFLNDTSEIFLKKDGYTLSKVIKGKGVFAVAKRKQDHDIILKKTNHLFCQMLLLANKE